jgi:ankyrin repeat protein
VVLNLQLVHCGDRRYSAFPNNLQIGVRWLRRVPLLTAMVTPFVHAHTGPSLGTPVTAQALRPPIAAHIRWALKLGLTCIVVLVSVIALPARADDDPFAVNARLLASVRNDDTAGIARALRDGAAVNSRNRLGESALLIALKKNRADIAQVLLDAGADVNEAAINGITPLMAAAFAGNLEMTRALLARGADTKGIDRIGKNAITYAAGEGHTAIVRLLIDKGVDPNAAYRNDLTALMWAAGYGHADTVRALIDAGARVEPVDDRGKSALDMAREFKHASTVEVLEQALKRPRP